MFTPDDLQVSFAWIMLRDYTQSRDLDLFAGGSKRIGFQLLDQLQHFEVPFQTDTIYWCFVIIIAKASARTEYYFVRVCVCVGALLPLKATTIKLIILSFWCMLV